MRKFFTVLLILMVIASFTVGASAKSFVNKNYDVKTLSNELSDALKEMIIDNYSQYYKNIGVNLSLMPDSVMVKEGVASAVFNAEINVTLKADKIEDLPFMKGMIDYYSSKKAALSNAQIEAANNLINDWKLELKDYIGKPEPTSYAIFKITATVLYDGILRKII